MKTRRVLLKNTLGIGALSSAFPSAWVKPIVNSVLLPAHATMSICFESSLVGVWLFEGMDNGITLYKNGVSDAGLGGGVWSVDGSEIRIFYDGVDHLIIGELSQNCKRIEGIDINQCCADVDTTQIEVVLVKKP